MSHALAVEGLRKRYGATQAVDGLDLTVDEGEIFGILGPNGSGKTTTVECSYGLRTADEGRIRVFGVDPQSDPDALRTLVGAQLQDSALPDRIRVVGGAAALRGAVPAVGARGIGVGGVGAGRQARRQLRQPLRRPAAAPCTWRWPWSPSPAWSSSTR
jgi:putative protein kinase ArgK-like GTPase of G3E family